MPGQASIRSRLTIRLWSPVPPTSSESLAAPKPPWLGNTVSLGSLRWVAQSNYPAPSSRPSVYRGRLEPNAFENAWFLWQAGQQHACTTYQALLQTPLTIPAVGRLKYALAALEK